MLAGTRSTSTATTPPNTTAATTTTPTSTQSNLDCLVEACITVSSTPTTPTQSSSRPSSSQPSLNKPQSTTRTTRTTIPSQGKTSSYYTCAYKGCGRAFSKKWNLGAHLRLHTGERPFICGQCGKSFMWKSSMKSHERTHKKLVMNASKQKMLADDVKDLAKNSGGKARNDEVDGVVKRRRLDPQSSNQEL